MALLIGMFLEILSIGIVLPLFSAILDPEFINSVKQYLGPSFDFLTIDTQFFILIIIGGFFGVYICKTMALVFILKKQMMFVYTLQADLSRRLFASYLKRDYTFHIERNSSELIRNTITEVTLLVQNGVLQLLTLIAEFPVFLSKYLYGEQFVYVHRQPTHPLHL